VTVLVDHFAAAAPVGEGIDPQVWASLFEEMFAEVVASAFIRREPRLRVRAHLLGLVSGLERKNGWTLAEFAGDAAPDGMQQLLNDETASRRAGSARRGCSGSTPALPGRSLTARSGVFLAYAVPSGARTLIDRSCMCPGPGAVSGTGAMRLASRLAPGSRRSRSWRG
jgi:hypothetical protein